MFKGDLKAAEGLDDPAVLDEELRFVIRVQKTNYFSIKFNYAADLHSKAYHFFIERLSLVPHGDYKNLLVGSAIVGGQPPMSFGVGNIGADLSLRQPRFDIEAVIKVPFFRSGHFLNLTNTSTYKKGEDSVMGIELQKGTGGKVVLLDKVVLETGKRYTYPITF